MTPTDPPEVIVTTRATSPTLSLDISFSGVDPPRALFADLERIGWRPPVVPPPPKHAIDWHRPDPRTGKAFTILDYRVDRASVAPPPGAGPRSTWTAADRAAFVVPLREVLLEHGLAGHPSVAKLFDGAVIDLRDPSPVPSVRSSPPPSPTPPATSASTSTSTPSATKAGAVVPPVFHYVRISAPTTPETWATAERTLRARRQPPRLVSSPVTGASANRSPGRGSHDLAAVGTAQLEIVVPAPAAPTVCDLLHDLGLEPTRTPASEADFETFEQARLDDLLRADAEREFVLCHKVEDCIAVLVDEAHLDAVHAVISSLRIRAMRSGPANAPSHRHAGRPGGTLVGDASLVEVCVPPVYVELVVTELANAAGLAPDDGRITVTRPSALPRRASQKNGVSHR